MPSGNGEFYRTRFRCDNVLLADAGNGALDADRGIAAVVAGQRGGADRPGGRLGITEFGQIVLETGGLVQGASRTRIWTASTATALLISLAMLLHRKGIVTSFGNGFTMARHLANREVSQCGTSGNKGATTGASLETLLGLPRKGRLIMIKPSPTWRGRRPNRASGFANFAIVQSSQPHNQVFRLGRRVSKERRPASRAKTAPNKSAGIRL